jgi:hypothetical protein
MKNQRDLQTRLFAFVKTETEPEMIDRKVRAIIEEAMKKFPEGNKKEIDALKVGMEAQIQMLKSPWLRYFITYDPRPALRQVRCPVLALIGSKDLQVEPEANLRAIDQALQKGGNKDFAVKELPGLNHLFQSCATGSLDEYAKIEETIAEVARPRKLQECSIHVQRRRLGRRPQRSNREVREVVSTVGESGCLPKAERAGPLETCKSSRRDAYSSE